MPQNSETPQREGPETGTLNLAAREYEIIEKYRSIGVELAFWAGQEPKIRDVEIAQLTELLPEIQTRVAFVKRLEISGYKLHWYRNEEKFLQINLEQGVDGALTYLKSFDRVRAYETQLNGTRLERAGETAELLEADLNFYEKVDLIGLLKDRGYINAVAPSGILHFSQSSRILSIRQDVSADQLKEKLDDIGRWHELSVELGIEIEDKTADLLLNSFKAAVDALRKKMDVIKLVLDLVKKIEITREFSERNFDLDTGVFQFSRSDAAYSGDLWLALADYKLISSALNIPINIPAGMRDSGAPLSDGLTLVLENIETVRAKRDRIIGIRIGPGAESKCAPDQVLWVGSYQTPADFKAFLDSL